MKTPEQDPRHPGPGATLDPELRARSDREIDRYLRRVRYWPAGLYLDKRWGRRLLGLIHSHVGPGQQMLDIGCGPAFVHRPIIEASGLVWSGADVLVSDDPAYRQVVDNRLDFPSGSFDMVGAFQVLEHFVDVEAMLQEVRRVLKPGGVFLGACAFWEMEHESYVHMTHRGLRALLLRHAFEVLEISPSPHTGSILDAQRFFGGSGRMQRGAPATMARDLVVGTLNWGPFLLANGLEFLRRRVLGSRIDPFRNCASLLFVARRDPGSPG